MKICSEMRDHTRTATLSLESPSAAVAGARPEDVIFHIQAEVTVAAHQPLVLTVSLQPSRGFLPQRLKAQVSPPQNWSPYELTFETVCSVMCLVVLG